MAIGGLEFTRPDGTTRRASRSKEDQQTQYRTSPVPAFYEKDIESQEITSPHPQSKEPDCFSSDDDEGSKSISSDSRGSSKSEKGLRMEAKAPNILEVPEMKAKPNSFLEDIKEAISTYQLVSRLVYFAAITFFTGMLSARPYTDKDTTDVPAIAEVYMVMEMILAFICVSYNQYSIFVHDFVEVKLVVSRFKLADSYIWIAPANIWLFTTIWSIIYTMHVPASLQHYWQWSLTAACVAANTAILYLLLTGNLVKDGKLVVERNQSEVDPADLAAKKLAGDILEGAEMKAKPSNFLEAIKETIGNYQLVSRLVYFAAITFFTGMLSARPYTDKETAPLPATAEGYMVVEMISAFLFVSYSQYSIFVHDFVEVNQAVPRFKISDSYIWIAPTNIWLFTTIWSITYTMHVPANLQHYWQWSLTGACLAANSVILYLLLTRKNLVKEGKVVVECQQSKRDSADMAAKKLVSKLSNVVRLIRWKGANRTSPSTRSRN